MQNLVASLSAEFWMERFYTGWQYAFLSQLADKTDAYPLFMSTSAWGYKDINSILGSWTQLKHDTILYTKMPEGLGGGGPPASPATPSFVEPNPDVFYRLAYAASTLKEGLTVYLSDWDNRGWIRIGIPVEFWTVINISTNCHAWKNISSLMQKLRKKN